MRLEPHHKEQRKEQQLLFLFNLHLLGSNFCELKQQSLSGCHPIGLFHCVLTIADGSNVSSSASAPLFHHLFRLLLGIWWEKKNPVDFLWIRCNIV